MSTTIEELVASHPTLLGENGLLFRHIDEYVEDFIGEAFLQEHDGEYPNWKDDLMRYDEDEVDEFLDEVIQKTINSEDCEDYNMGFFRIPPTYRNAHGLILQYISINGKDRFGNDYKVDDGWIFDIDRACVAYACFWLENNKDWLKNRLKEFRLYCIENEEEEVSN